MNINIIISPQGITCLLLKLIGALFIANLISIYLKWELGYITALGFVPLFDFDQEYNLPTFYSTLALLYCAVLLWYISVENKNKNIAHSHYWKLLSLLFLVLSFDEMSSFHNQFSRLTKLVFHNITSIANGEIISQSRFWILTYFPILLIVGVYFIPFFLKIPKKTRKSFVIAGTVFIGGAVGVELLGDWYIIFWSEADIYYALLFTLEELFEMIGVLLFIRALVTYISNYSVNPHIYARLSFVPSDKSKKQ
ncbi:hypothetical protein [Cyclobacterium jeungdonense]|uniref:Uncharacterized protein n=1 Tax=Cyclobacterium jeungdonense TaxID=708087 RepID=A0ABT8CB08_9BACT|nr:hypothetical protein [Cyclobacterium jeungdonense]MDN3688861.1 hypothetical protein [Cyclobacterium jeungdonense]